MVENHYTDVDGTSAIHVSNVDCNINDNCNFKSNEDVNIGTPTKNSSDQSSTYLEITRPIYNLEKFHCNLGERAKRSPLKDRLRTKVKATVCTCTVTCWISTLMNLFPVTKWLPKYSVKNDLVADILGGLTVGVMSIPQGMAYARLAGMPPVYGLYTNLVPTMIYFIFGTSKIAAMGSATVTSLMMGAIRYKHIPCHDCWMLKNINSSFDGNLTIQQSEAIPLTPIDIGSATAFLVGIFLIIMGLLRLNVISTYLSDQIVSGFTAGAAVHIFTAQLDAIFGLSFHENVGVGKIVIDYIQLFRSIHKTNLVTLLISSVTLIFLIVLKLIINPRIQKKIKIFLPGELIVVIVGSLVSYLLNARTNYGVKVVEHISSKLPFPTYPRFDLMNSLLLDSLVLAVVTYCQCISQVKMYAKIRGYNIDTRQEFFAYGAMNAVGSFFQSFNSAMSVSRSIVYDKSGARSQLTGLIGTSVVIVTILVLAPFLEPLPQGVLAAIIIVACIDLLRQLKELAHLWKISKVDFSIYLMTFCCIVLLDVTYGLLAGVLFAFFSVVVRTQCKSPFSVGTVAGTDLYAEVDKFATVDNRNDIKVVHFDCPLYYANVDGFKKKVFKICGVNNKFVTAAQLSENNQQATCETNVDSPQHLVINCIGFSYIDLMGVNALKQLYIDLNAIGVSVWFANTNNAIHKMLFRTNFYEVVPKEKFFVTVHDVVAFLALKESLYSQYHEEEIINKL